MDQRSYRIRAGLGFLLLGIGLGGFVDGIFLHQILQWHQMLSTLLPPTTMERMHTNMRWDGYFHAGMLVLVLTGLGMLWSAARQPLAFPGMRWMAGLMLMGWGIFNITEALINHHLLGLHHVRYVGDIPGGRPDMLWEWGFLLVGGPGLIIPGWLLWRMGKRATE